MADSAHSYVSWLLIDFMQNAASLSGFQQESPYDAVTPISSVVTVAYSQQCIVSQSSGYSYSYIKTTCLI